MEASKRIEYRLTEILNGPGEPSQRRLGIRGLAELAQERSLISDETLAAVEGMSFLRNLVAYSVTTSALTVFATTSPSPTR